MDCPVRYIIYLTVQNYLTDTQQEHLLEDLSRRKIGDKQFISIVKKHFDIERLRVSPFIWQDIWIYNYLQYEINAGVRNSKHIKRYYNEIIAPQRQAIEATKRLLTV